MVPRGWSIVNLKDIVDGSIKNGFSPNPAERDTGYWVLGLGALGDNGLIVDEIKPVEPTKKVLDSCLMPGDFLISRSNTPDKVGRSALFKGEIKNCSYPDLMMRFRINERIADATFIESKLTSHSIRNYYKNCAAGSSSTMVKINKPIVEKTPLLLPPLLEQKKIARILSTWDIAIEVTEKILSSSQQQRRSLMQQLLTGKKRLPGFSGKWVHVRVGDVLSVRNEKQIPSETSPLFSLTIENGITAKTERYNREFLVKNSDEKEYKTVKPNDIAYNPANLRWGAINYSRLTHDVVVSPIYEVLYIKDNTSNNLQFVAQILMSDRQITKFASMVEGTLMERKAVKIGPFLATKISVPSMLEEQQKIASVLSAADKEIEAIQQKLTCLKQEKKALMQQLLIGKRRVKVDEEEISQKEAVRA